MDIKGNNIAGKVVSGCLLALSASMAYSGVMGPASTGSPVNVYLGVFGGGGSLSSLDITQYGTAFFIEGEGGPLAVNAFGRSDTSSTGLIGGHIGFAWPNTGISFPVTPAIELEGFYMGGAKINGPDLRNDTDRLDEHDFRVHYPLKTGVFLVNAVLNSSNAMFSRVKPYVGVGIGSAVVSVSGATSIQFAPPEAINHYNGNPDDTAVTFAAQPKVGLRFDISSRASVFAEYRFVYLSELDFTFGSTVPTATIPHPVTSPWLVNMKPQYYNMGTIGIDFDI